MARSSASALRGDRRKASDGGSREGTKRTIAIRALPADGVSTPGDSATAHQPSHHEPACRPAGGCSAPGVSRKDVNSRSVPPAVEVDGTGYVARCPKHPRYRGLGKPRLPCEACWAIFFGLSETCVNCGCQQIEVEE